MNRTTRTKETDRGIQTVGSDPRTPLSPQDVAFVGCCPYHSSNYGVCTLTRAEWRLHCSVSNLTSVTEGCRCVPPWSQRWPTSSPGTLAPFFVVVAVVAGSVVRWFHPSLGTLPPLPWDAITRPLFLQDSHSHSHLCDRACVGQAVPSLLSKVVGSPIWVLWQNWRRCVRQFFWWGPFARAPRPPPTGRRILPL
jgi:hypothetical protein